MLYCVFPYPLCKYCMNTSFRSWFRRVILRDWITFFPWLRGPSGQNVKLGHSTHVVFLGAVFVLFFRPLFFTCVLLLYWFQFGLRFCRMIKEVNESLGGGGGGWKGEACPRLLYKYFNSSNSNSFDFTLVPILHNSIKSVFWRLLFLSWNTCQDTVLAEPWVFWCYRVAYSLTLVKPQITLDKMKVARKALFTALQRRHWNPEWAQQPLKQRM